MKNKRTKLLQSLIALLLCLSMLVGTTFAWFTDAVSTGINMIAAGTLDVELYHSNATVSNEQVDSSTKLFMDLQGDPILWEPGVVSYENLRVANAGDLALAYQLGINTENENFVVDPSGAMYGLSQILKVGVVEGGITASDRAGVVASVEEANWTTLASFLRSGKLLPEGVGESEKTWGIVIYWEPGENDNFWNLNNGKHLNEGDVLSIDLGIRLIATQEQYEADSFGDDYDSSSKFEFFPDFVGGSISADVETNAQHQTVSEVVMTIGKVKAIIPAGVQLTEGTTALTLSVSEMSATGSNVQLNENEIMRSLDVHIEGVADGNTVPITVTLTEVAPTGLNMGNYKLYHVEKDGTKDMSLVDSAAAFTAHNQFKYDPATGNISLYMATFSEVAVVADAEKAWEGGVDHSWYDNSETELTIANADQLWSFSQIVGGMAEEIDQNDFAGKTVKLISDINLGDKEDASDNLFYPIGYYNDAKLYTKPTDGTKTVANVSSFEGTFDGNGHTIANFYQNTWQMWGNYDGNNYKAAMGLFGYVNGGTVKNLTVDHFSSDGEFTPTGVIAAYAVNATFENIAITNCNPRVYNTGNGGIVGIGGSENESDDHENVGLRFTNITIDNTNKITALWGSWDVACGGLVGMFRGPNSVWMTNCHVAAQIDVYNDVCGNYQYYWYRYSGMMIGTNKNMVTDNDGYTVPETTKFYAKDCTVHFGDWNDYYYCELVDNSLASYTHDHQMSRLTEVKAVNGTTITYLDGTTGTVPNSGRANYVVVNGTEGTDNAKCYHFKNGVVWNHAEAGEETVDGKTVLKEDKQHIYLPFNQLFTGYGWGVKHVPIYDDESANVFEGITILRRDEAGSVDKFELVDVLPKIVAGKTYTVGDFFSAKANIEVAIDTDNVHVFVSPEDSSKMVYVEYTPNTTDWKMGTLRFYGQGEAKIKITDYFYCKETPVTVTVIGNGSLYRVGNAGFEGNTSYDVTYKDIARLLTGKEEYTTIELNNTELLYTESDSKVNFSDTGIVGVKINGVQYYLEVVDAVNTTSATSATASNVVLLNNIGSGFAVSGRYTFYGNGFTLNYTGNGQYLNNGLKQGVVTVSENGTLDNLRINASIYPSAYLYYGANSFGDAAQSGPSDGNNRYYYQLSAVAAKDNATISNCYIYGGRNNIFVNTGDVTVTDTVLECGVVANVQIQSNSSHTITFNNVTTIQHQVNPTLDDTSLVMLGAGILVGPETTENPAIILNGNFKQYNWVTAEDQEVVSNSMAQAIIQGALDVTSYNHTINGKTASNLGIIYMNEYEAVITDNTGLPYKLGTVDMTVSGKTLTGRVYSIQNATAEQIYSDYVNADKDTVNGYYAPQFKYSADLGGQCIAKSDDGDEYCYREGDTIHVMFPSGDSKELDLAGLVNITKYSGQDLDLGITCKDENNNIVTITGSKISLSEAGEYTVTYTVTDTLFYNENGEVIEKIVNYSWDITVNVSLKDKSVPDAYFEFVPDNQKMGYYKPIIGDVKQYLPFLAGLKIYDYNGQTSYLRFDGDNDFNKIASITITEYVSNEAYLEIKLTDGGVIHTKFLARADSGGGSTYTGKIKTSNNVIYFVTDSGTSNKDATTTAAYWYVDYYKFTGNNGVAIQSEQQTFNSTGSSASTPSGSFSTTIKYTVSYDANGGNCGQTTGYATSASSAVTLPTPTRSGYIFAGWYTAASGGTRVGGAGESYTPSANITLYAQWGLPCTVTYNANGGSCDTTTAQYTGTALTLPTATRDGYWFIGWYTAASGGNKIGDAGATYNPSGNITLYAQWQEQVKYTVTYDANGGTCGTASATYEGTALTLPTSTKTGHTFKGWYTATSGGTKVGDAGASYTPSTNIVLYAQWEKIAYTITVSTSNATVSGVTNGQTAYYGDTISVTVSFSQNNSKTLTVTDASGNTILSKSAAGTYTFTMPASNVTISASSSGSCFTSDTRITLADGTQKRINEITYADRLLVWDFDKGEYTVATSSIIENHGFDVNDVIKLVFEDGTQIKVVNVHGFFDADLNKWVDIDAENAQSFIGHSFTQIDGDDYKTVKLISAEVTAEYVEAWSVLTADHYNCIVEGMFSVTPPATEQLTFFEIGGNMMYDAEAKKADIDKYGLYTYDEFAHLLTYEQFDAFNIPEIKVAIGKGLITYEEVLWLIATYAGN